jgi:hypothetical protein
MRRIKVLSLLVFAALITAAFAVPAAASAYQWTAQGNPLSEKDPNTIEFSGTYRAEFLGSGMICSVHGKGRLKAGDTGELTEFTATPSTCSSFGQYMSGCKAGSIETNMPRSFKIDSSGKTITISEMTFNWASLTGCSAGYKYFNTKGNITVTPDTTHGWHSWALSGTVTGSTNFWEATMQASGSLSMTPSGYYWIS